MNFLVKRFWEFFFGLIGKKVEYYRSMGIKIGSGFQAGSHIEWGTEPYLIEIGNDVKITDNVRFITHDGGLFVLRNLYDNMRKADVFGQIKIGNNVFVGNNVIFLPDVQIGNNVVIGAGSIVTRNIPDNNIACGIPCRVVSTTAEYYARMEKKALHIKGMEERRRRELIVKKFSVTEK